MHSTHMFMFSISIMFDGSLEILNATKNDEGLYTCFAENDRGRANSTGYLTITGIFVDIALVFIYIFKYSKF